MEYSVWDLIVSDYERRYETKFTWSGFIKRYLVSPLSSYSSGRVCIRQVIDIRILPPRM